MLGQFGYQTNASDILTCGQVLQQAMRRALVIPVCLQSVGMGRLEAEIGTVDIVTNAKTLASFFFRLRRQDAKQLGKSQSKVQKLWCEHLPKVYAVRTFAPVAFRPQWNVPHIVAGRRALTAPS